MCSCRSACCCGSLFGLAPLLHAFLCHEHAHDTYKSCNKLVMQPFYVQVGQHYLAAQWGQSLMTLSSFIDQHLLSTAPDSSTDAGV